MSESRARITRAAGLVWPTCHIQTCIYTILYDNKLQYIIYIYIYDMLARLDQLRELSWYRTRSCMFILYRISYILYILYLYHLLSILYYLFSIIDYLFSISSYSYLSFMIYELLSIIYCLISIVYCLLSIVYC